MSRTCTLLLMTVFFTVGSACTPTTSVAQARQVVVLHRPLSRLDRPDAALVDELDRGVQARFRNVRDEDIRVGNLGVGRYAALGMRHFGGIVRHDLPEERRIIEGISSAGWSSATFFVDAQRLGTGTAIGPVVNQAETWELFRDPGDIKGLAAQAMSSKGPARGTAPGITLEARPILASEASCLRCHRRRRLGEPLGAVVYAFRGSAISWIWEGKRGEPSVGRAGEEPVHLRVGDRPFGERAISPRPSQFLRDPASETHRRADRT